MEERMNFYHRGHKEGTENAEIFLRELCEISVSFVVKKP